MAIALFLQFFFIILLSPKITKANVTHVQTLCLEHEKTLLLKVKNQLVFDSSSSTRLVTWNQTDDCCSWKGVKCDSAGHVISLQLNDDGISGGFNESSSLFSLNYLKELNLAANNMEGSHFPRAIVNLTHLTSLSLGFCSLEGHVPEMIFQLPNLQNLDLSYNSLLTGTLPQFPDQNNSFRSIVIVYTNFSGPLPNSIGNLRRLSVLDLSHSKFSGAIPFTLGNLTQLVRVDLTDNFFTGSIASNHFEGLSKVEGMDLSYNSLSGTIPISIFTLPSLQVLELNHNQFSGQVSEFSNLSIFNLSFLDLSTNQLESPIPNTFFKLQSLRFLDLSNNLFNDTFQLEKILNLPNLGGLDLSNNSLSLDATSIHSSSISFHAKNSSLNTLDLSNNKIGGEIPSWIWELKSLTELNLSSNSLVDLQKPYNVSAALSLLVLDLHSNQLRGELPLPPRQAIHVDYSNNHFDKLIPNNQSFSSYGLQFLSIANNSLSGPFPVTFICKCTYLQVLDLSVNSLSGSIPPCLFENVTYLQVLNLERNNISGRIPDNFSASCELKTLDLGHNHLVGDIPISLENCTGLAVMNVGNNHINGNFPCMLPSSLQILVLRSNRFHGEVRCQKQSWPNLQIIDISSNNFSGYLNPFNFSSWRGMMLNSDGKLERTELRVFAGSYQKFYYWDEVILTIKGLELKLVKIWPEFTSIDFSSNNFHGDIPQVIADLNALYLLNFSHNSLTGAIPKSFSNLTLLGALDLSVNQLTGKMPEEIAGLTFLQVMNVSHNKLVGKIPIGSQIQTFSTDSFEGNAGLCGLPLNISCTNDTNSAMPPDVASDKEIEWDYVFAAAGYAVGLGIFSWVLLFCRSFRYKYF